MPNRRNILKTSAFIAVAVSMAAFFRLGNPTIDPDSFYHFRYGAIYAERGPFYSEFPWLVRSILGTHGGDIGYGYHLLLAPLAAIEDSLLGIRVAAITGLAALLLMLYLVLQRHRVAYSALWPFGAVLLSPPMLLVLQMARPHVLTTGLAVVLVSSILRGRVWGVLLASFGIAFLHLNISPIILVLAITTVAAKGLTEKQWEWRHVATAGGGWVFGWVCRPVPLAVAKIEQAQVVMHGIARQQGLPLIFGLEWQPLDLTDTLFKYAPFLVIWGCLALAFAATEFSRRRLPAPRRSLLWSSLLLSVMFFVFSLVNTRRGMTLWAVFAVFFVAAAFDALVVPEIGEAGRKRGLFRALAAVMLAAFSLGALKVADEMVLRPKWIGDPPGRARVAAQWLRGNTPAGSVILNVNWWDFPELFFWNTHNRYVGGLDPIFQYAYSPSLYWKVHHLQVGDTLPLTCGNETCSPDELESIPEVVQQDFGADFIVLDADSNAELYEHLSRHREYELCVEDQRMAVFRLLSSPASRALISPALGAGD